MTEEIHGRLTAFISSALAQREGRTCTKIQLVYGKSGVPGEEQYAISRGDYADPEQSPFESLALVEDTVSRIIEIAERHADTTTLMGNHRYEVRAHQTLGGKTRCPFVIHVASEDGVGDGSIAPDATGVLRMTMQHTELLIKQNSIMVGTSITTLRDQVRDLTEENARLRKERSDFFIELENSRSQQSEREIAMLSQGASDERKKLALEKVLQFMPIVASKLLASGESGKAASVEAAANPLTLIINELAASLDETQIMKILPTLNTPQQAMFLQAFDIARRSADAAKAKAAEQNKTNGTPAATAAGAAP